MQRGTPPSPLGHPTFILGAPHLHPWGTPPQPPASASTCGPSQMSQSQANRPLPHPHAPGPADAAMGASLDSLLSPPLLTRSSPLVSTRELGRSLQALSALGSQVCPSLPQGCVLPEPQACAQPASASHPPAQLPSPCLPDPGRPLHARLSAAPWVWPHPASRQVGHCPSCAPRWHPCLILIPQIARSWHRTLRFLVPLPLLNISIIFFSGLPVDLKHFLKQYG